MKTGRTLSQLAAELERQAKTRKDYIAPQGAIHVEPSPTNEDVHLVGINGQPMAILPHAHRQVADHLGIPQKYYERMRTTRPVLLSENINTWLRADENDQRMVRTLDGKVRAFMSARYRPLDNFELANAILPKMLDLGVDITSTELTETRLYIKGFLPSLSDELPEGAVWGTGHTRVAEYGSNKAGKVVAAIVVSNSEVGAGSLRIEPSVFTTWCTNLAIIDKVAMRKYHVGRSNDVGEDFSIYRDETRLAEDKAFWLKVQDVTAAAFDAKIFKAAVAQIKDASAQKIVTTDLTKVVEKVVKVLDLPEPTTGGIMTMLARGGDLSKWGLSSAISALANDAEGYEDATDLERASGKVLALGARDWNAIATAA